VTFEQPYKLTPPSLCLIFFSELGFAFSNTANIFILMILDDFCLLPVSVVRNILQHLTGVCTMQIAASETLPIHTAEPPECNAP
jgi:hypothetical protein